MATSRKTTTDYVQKKEVTLKKQVVSAMLITENRPLILNNADIVNLFFIEDIFKFCMVGTIVFNDRYNIMELGPFTGNEKLAIIYSIEEKTRELIFDIWKVGKIQQLGPGIREESENLVTMHFVDPYYAGYNLRKYSRSWADTEYSTIMSDILNNMVFARSGGRRVNIEQSSNKTDFVIPYWKPQTAMKWLMRRAVGRQSGTSGYLVFNNTDNLLSHNIVTLNYLLTDFNRTIDLVPYTFGSSEVSKENKILEWWISGLDRNSNAIVRGGVWKGYDFQTKKLLNHEHVYSEGADETMMLGRKTLYNQIDDIQSSNVMVGDSSDDLINNIAYNDWAKRYNMQFILNIIVEGHEKRFAGQQIEIQWPAWARNLGNQVQFNDLLKGKYLIKSVTHSFNPGSTYPYKQRLVLIKNAYTNINSKILYDAKRKNIYQEGNVQQVNILGSG